MVRAPKDIRTLLAEWYAFASVHAQRHREHAIKLERRHYALGVPATILAAVVGTTIFGALEKAAASWPVRVALGVTSMLAASLAALQTFFRLSERAATHNVAHAEYEEVSRAIRLEWTTTKTRPEWDKTLRSVAERLDATKRRCPIPPQSGSIDDEIGRVAGKVMKRMSARVVQPGSVDDVLSKMLPGRGIPAPAEATASEQAIELTPNFVTELDVFANAE